MQYTLLSVQSMRYGIFVNFNVSHNMKQNRKDRLQKPGHNKCKFPMLLAKLHYLSFGNIKWFRIDAGRQIIFIIFCFYDILLVDIY